jgi:hypothetical protein
LNLFKEQNSAYRLAPSTGEISKAASAAHIKRFLQLKKRLAHFRVRAFGFTITSRKFKEKMS